MDHEEQQSQDEERSHRACHQAQAQVGGAQHVCTCIVGISSALWKPLQIIPGQSDLTFEYPSHPACATYLRTLCNEVFYAVLSQKESWITLTHHISHVDHTRELLFAVWHCSMPTIREIKHLSGFRPGHSPSFSRRQDVPSLWGMQRLRQRSGEPGTR